MNTVMSSVRESHFSWRSFFFQSRVDTEHPCRHFGIYEIEEQKHVFQIPYISLVIRLQTNLQTSIFSARFFFHFQIVEKMHIKQKVGLKSGSYTRMFKQQQQQQKCCSVSNVECHDLLMLVNFGHHAKRDDSLRSLPRLCAPSRILETKLGKPQSSHCFITLSSPTFRSRLQDSAGS